MSEPLLPYDDGPLTFRDYWEILRLPALFALAAIAGTWAVWYLTSASCPPELAQTAGCNPGRIAQYISLDALNKMVTHAVVGGGGGGLWSYAMITRQRKVIEAERRAREAERRAREAERTAREAAEKRALEERERADQERQQADRERESANRERERADRERQRAEEERRRLLARIEELEARQNGHNDPEESAPGTAP